MIAYADTSFLGSLYGADANSARADAEYERGNPRLHVTPFGELEMTNAFHARVYRREITPAQCDASLRAFHSDIDAGVLTRAALPPGIFDRALRVTKRQTRSIGSRTLDVMHVAIALELDARLFLTFDANQAKLARAVGLTVHPSSPRIRS